MDMARTPNPNWWALALRGLFGILFGFIAFTLPGVTLAALTLLFGAYALSDGILSLAAAFHAASLHHHWWALLEGIVGIGAAAVTRLRHILAHEWLLAVAGVASILFRILLFGAPGPGAVVIAWWIGAYT